MDQISGNEGFSASGGTGPRLRRTLDRLRSRVTGRGPLARDRNGRRVSRPLQIATARFLAATAYGDGDSIRAEHRTIRRGIQDLFGVSRRSARMILEAAGREDPRGNDPAVCVRDAFDLHQRMRIMGLAWELAYTDGLMPIFERVLADRIGALAGLMPHQAVAARSFANPPWF